MLSVEILTFESNDLLICKVANLIRNVAKRAVEERGIFSIVLSGGSTPATLYSMLVHEPYRSEIDWDAAYIFWGDERCVPPDHPESNFGQAQRLLLEPLAISEDHLYRIRGELEATEAAEHYSALIMGYFESYGPDSQFDMVLLGLGADGHTASLFPDCYLEADECFAVPVSAAYEDRASA